MSILEDTLEMALGFYLIKIMRIFLNDKLVSQLMKEQPESKLAKEIK